MIKEQQNKREEYEKRNADLKQKNEDFFEERKKRIIINFEKNDERIQNKKENTFKAFEKKKLENYIKEDYLNNQLKELENKTKYKNILKLKEMKEKNLRIEEKKKQRRELIEKTKKLKDDMRMKKLIMLKNAEKILENGRYKNKEEIYSKVFSPEELTILSSNSSSINTFYNYGCRSTKNIFNGSKIKFGNNKNLRHSSSVGKDNLLKKKKELEFSY